MQKTSTSEIGYENLQTNGTSHEIQEDLPNITLETITTEFPYNSEAPTEGIIPYIGGK